MAKPRSKKRARRRVAAREPPGGPGAMAALRRAQAKLKEMGIKPYKAPEPPAAKPKVRTSSRPSK